MRYLIIGGTKGIGRAIVELLLEEGAEVLIGSREKGGLPEGAVWFSYDALSGDIPTHILESPLQGLVYAPGSITLRPFRSLKSEQFREDYEINVIGAVRAIQAALPALKKSGQASILLFSTVAVRQGMPFHASIAAAKGAVEGLTRSLAAELAPLIRVNALAPSLTNTSLAEKLLATPEKMEASGQRHPLRRTGTPEDMAGLAALLLRPENNWITGQIIGVDGGLSTLRI